MIASNTTKYYASAHGFGSHGAAFRNLACMPCEALRKAAQDRQRGKQGGIATTSGEDEFRTLLQRPLQ